MTAEFPYAPPQKRHRPWLLLVGGALVLVSLVMCLGGGYSFVSGLQDVTDQTPHTGSHSVQLEEGESTNVYSENPLASCTANGPTGPVQDSSFGTQNISWGDTELHRVMKVEAPETGEYTLSCTAPFVVGDGFSTAGIVLAVAGAVVCALASLVILIGIILWAVRKR